MKLATLVLEEGTVIEGEAFGAETGAVFELVSNTSVTGYQENRLKYGHHDGNHPVQYLPTGEVLNTSLGPHAHTDRVEIRKAAIAMNVPLLTTLYAAMAAVSAIQAMSKKESKYRSLQSHFKNVD